MVPASDFGHVFEMAGKRQTAQHDDGLRHVIVDLVALLLGERTAAYAQIVDFTLVKFGRRRRELEAPRVVRRQRVRRAAHVHVLRLVGEELFGRRQRHRGRAVHAAKFLPRNADAIVKRAQPRALRDAFHPFNPLGRHEFTADIALGDKRIIGIEFGVLRIQRRFECPPVAARGDRFPVLDLGIAFEHFETRPDFVDAVANGLELGRLVDYVFGRGNLAAVVQPTRDMHCLPFVFAETEFAVRPLRCLARRARQHHRELGHALAMPAGIRRFRVNCAGDQLDESVEQVFLRLQQAPRLDRHRGSARKRLDERYQLVRKRLVGRLAREHAPEREHADDFLLAIVQRDRSEPDAAGAEHFERPCEIERRLISVTRPQGGDPGLALTRRAGNQIGRIAVDVQSRERPGSVGGRGPPVHVRGTQ